MAPANASHQHICAGPISLGSQVVGSDLRALRALWTDYGPLGSYFCKLIYLLRVR